MNFFGELKRRNVFKVAIAYIVVGWVVLQVAETIAPIMNLPETLSKYILFFLIVGFPITIFFSWVYELTPDGLKKQSEVDLDTSITMGTGRKIDFIIMGAMVLAIGGLIYDRVGNENTSADGDSHFAKSIAVLPFVSMSSGADDEYFSDGLTEELLNALAKVKELKVAGRTSSFFYKGKTPTFQEVGKALNVAHVLEGSVRRAGNQLRITAQLIEAENGYHLWSETYTREHKDVFQIQEDIANQVTAVLKVKLLGEEAEAIAHHGTDNAEAKSLYMIALARMRSSENFGSDQVFSAGHYTPARQALEKAVEIDPNYAEAWAALSRAYASLGTNVTADNIDSLSWKEAARLSSMAADKAYVLSPDLPEAVLVKAISLMLSLDANGGGDYPQVDDLMNRALELAPDNVDIISSVADWHHRSSKDYDLILSLYDRAIEREPLSKFQLKRASALRFAGRAEDARAAIRNVSKLFPTSPWQGSMGLLELDRAHLHHFVLWNSGLENVDYHVFAWVSLGGLEQALEIERGFLGLGGDLELSLIVGMYLMQRDYQGLSDYLEGTKIENRSKTGPGYKFITAIYLRDWPGAVANWEQNLRNYPESKDTNLGTGTGPIQMQNTYPDRQKRDAYNAVWAAHAYKMAGNTEKTESLLNWALEITNLPGTKEPEANQSAHMLRAMVHIERGSFETALDEMDLAYGAGWRWLMGGKAVGTYPGDMGWFEDSPLLDPIRKHPRFIAFIKKVTADNAAMRAELNAGLTLEDIMDEK